MTYTEKITTALIETLTRNSHLDPSQLAGQAANIGFWTNEIVHCRELLSHYDDRFRCQKEGQQKFQEARGSYSLQQYKSPSDLSGPPLKRGLKSSRIKQLDRDLVDAYRIFLERCVREGLLTQNDAETHWNSSCSDRNFT